MNNHPKKEFADLTEWNAHLKELKIVNHRHIKIATEGALIGSLLYHGLPKNLVIVSDDAGQFNILSHSQCWIHAECTLNKRKILGSTRSELGRRCRDAFTSLKKICRKLGVSFWNYLLDRLSKSNNIPPLQEIIAQYGNPP